MKKTLFSLVLTGFCFTTIFSQNQNLNKMDFFSDREQIIETTNRLFNFTDAQNWVALQEEVFASEVTVDMVSMGMPEVKKMTAIELCAMWQNGFSGLDAVFHLAGNHAVTLREKDADMFCYSSATHFKKSATMGNTRTFNGTYDLHLVKTEKGWRIDSFKYNLKYTEGNMDLK
jgi:SnoaL-like domain